VSQPRCFRCAMTPHERRPLHAETEIRALMRRQLGLITTAQARESISEATITRRVQAAHWARLLPGVYRDTLVPSSLEQSCFAANLWGGADAVIARKAAGALWQLDGLAAPKPELWVPRTANARSELVVVHRGAVAPNDRRMLGPITLTSPGAPSSILPASSTTKTSPPSSKTRYTAGSPPRCRCAAASTPSAAKGARGLRACARSSTTAPINVPRCRALRSEAGGRYAPKASTPSASTRWRAPPLPTGSTAPSRNGVWPSKVGDKFHRSPRNRKRELRRLADLATVHWRALPVTWDEITDTPDDVIARIITTLAA
jgi:hypothetical protein